MTAPLAFPATPDSFGSCPSHEVEISYNSHSYTQYCESDSVASTAYSSLDPQEYPFAAPLNQTSHIAFDAPACPSHVSPLLASSPQLSHIQPASDAQIAL